MFSFYGFNILHSISILNSQTFFLNESDLIGTNILYYVTYYFDNSAS